MTERFYVKNTLYPVLGITVSLLIFIGALLMARSIWGVIFLATVYILLCLFGYFSTCIKMVPFMVIYVGVFYLIFYLSSGFNAEFAVQMSVRLSGVAVAAIPGLSLPPVRLVRNLTQLNCPRFITLGMLITLSFVPVLNSEIKQVKNAMRTRGVTSVFNPAMLYRAFLIPLVVRLVNISDTLALSVETRGFVSDKNNFTVYKPVYMHSRDIAFAILFASVFITGIILTVMGVSLI